MVSLTRESESRIGHTPQVPTAVLLEGYEITNEDFATHCQKIGILTGAKKDVTADGVFKTTGICKRFRLQPLGETPEPIEKTVPQLAVKAAQKLILNSNINPAEIDYVFACTSYPMGRQISQVVRDQIGMRAQTKDVYAACTGPAYLLHKIREVREKFGKVANILIISAEHYSALMDPMDINGSLFSDGASALLLRLGEDFEITASEHFWDEDPKAIQMPIDYKKVPPGSLYLDVPNDTEYFRMNGRRVLSWFSGGKPIDMLASLYNDAKNRIQERKNIYAITHQGSGTIVDTIRQKLEERGIDVNFFANTVQHIGNLASGSCLTQFNALLTDYKNRIAKGDEIIFEGFGAGLAASAVTLTALRNLS